MNKLFVGNLTYSMTEDGVRTIFEEGGWTPLSVRIITDRETGRSRGFCFVELESGDDAAAAMQALDGAELDGRPIKVNEAQERSGGGGGRRF